MAFANLAGCFGVEVGDRIELLTSMMALMPDPRTNPISIVISDDWCLSSRSLLPGGEGGEASLASVEERNGELSMLAIDGSVDNLRELVCKAGISPEGGQALQLLHLFIRHGPNIVASLAGDYSIIVARRTSRELLLVRDAMGARPLYWGRHPIQPMGICVASLPRAIHAGTTTAVKVSSHAIWREMMGLSTVAPETIFAEVFQVPPGTYLSIRDGKIGVQQYYSIPKMWPTELDVDGIASEYGNCFNRAVSVRARRTQAKSAVMLSGGLDSSAVFGELSFVKSTPPIAATTVTTGASAEDEAFASQVVEHCGAHWIRTVSDVHHASERCIKWAANPFYAFRCWLSEPLLTAVREADCSLLYTGAVGDWSGGSNWGWSEYLRAQGISRTVRELQRCASATWGQRFRQLIRAEWDVRARDLGILGLARVTSSGRWSSAEVLSSLCDAPESLKRELIQQRVLRDLCARDPSIDRLEQAKWLLRRGVSDELATMDLLGRAYGIELAHPLADAELYAMAANLPWELRRNGSYTRIALRRAAESRLPASVAWRRIKVAQTDHIRKKWAIDVNATKESEMTALSGVVSLNEWKRLASRFDLQADGVARLLYQLTVLMRWSSLNGWVVWSN